MLGCIVQTLSVQSNQGKEKALLLGVASKDFMWEGSGSWGKCRIWIRDWARRLALACIGKRRIA